MAPHELLSETIKKDENRGQITVINSKMQITIMNQCEESFFHQKLSVEDDQFGAGRYEIVAFVELEELDKNLILVIYGKNTKILFYNPTTFDYQNGHSFFFFQLFSSH